MDEYDLDTTNLAGLNGHRDRLITLAEQCGQHDLAATLRIPTNLMEIPGLDEVEPITPVGRRKFFAIYDVVCRFRAHDHAVKVLAECLEHTKDHVGLADAMHEALEHATDNLPEISPISLEPHVAALFATAETAISALEAASESGSA